MRVKRKLSKLENKLRRILLDTKEKGVRFEITSETL